MNRIDFEACPDCDLLLHTPHPAIGEKAHCPACGFLLLRPRRRSVERTFALSLAGFFLLLPANFLPTLGLSILSNTKVDNLWSGVFRLYDDGMWEIAIVVFCTSILVPIIWYILVLIISGHLYFKRPASYLPKLMRTFHHLGEWSMLQVYMLGIIVAVVKLEPMAHLTFNWGLYAFIGLLIISAMLSSSMDRHLFWQQIELLNTPKNNDC